MILKYIKSNNFKWILLVLQSILIISIGIISKDMWYSIITSLLGVCFNLLVSYNISYGFIFGVLYAVANGVNAYFGKIYATFGFMVIMQAPVAIYSFYIWQKNKTNNETTLKAMSKLKLTLLTFSIIIIGVASYFLLNALHSENIIPDTIFFVFSVVACILLALRYKIAYIITLLSGLGGTVLWIFQMITTGNGASIAVFYIIVTINSVIAIIKNYYKKSSPVAINS